MAGGGGLAGVDVADDHDVDVGLLLPHCDMLVMNDMNSVDNDFKIICFSVLNLCRKMRRACVITLMSPNSYLTVSQLATLASNCYSTPSKQIRVFIKDFFLLYIIQ